MTCTCPQIQLHMLSHIAQTSTMVPREKSIRTEDFARPRYLSISARESASSNRIDATSQQHIVAFSKHMWDVSRSFQGRALQMRLKLKHGAARQGAMYLYGLPSQHRLPERPLSWLAWKPRPSGGVWLPGVQMPAKRRPQMESQFGRRRGR